MRGLEVREGGETKEDKRKGKDGINETLVEEERKWF